MTSKTVCVLKPTTLTSTPDPVYIQVPEQATGFIGFATVGTVSGTSPTLDIKIEQLVRTPGSSDKNGTPCLDGSYTTSTAIGYGLLTQITTSSSKRQFSSDAVGQYEAAMGNPSAGSFRVGAIGSIWKVTFTVGGTSPSFADVTMAVLFC